MELRLFKKDKEEYTRIKLSNKSERPAIVELACMLGEPIKTSKTYTYFETKGDISDTSKLLGLK